MPESGTFHTLKLQHQSINPSKSALHYPKLNDISKPHINSFNAIFTSLLQHINPKNTAIHPATNQKISFWLSGLTVSKPISDVHPYKPTYPSECRERGLSYKGKIQIRFNWKVNNGQTHSELKSLGYLPIIVGSIKCNLHQNSPSQLVQHKEDPEEFGGYFIVNGIERLIRLLIVPRRNHVIALDRPSFQKRGPTFTTFATQIRCVRPDQSSLTNSLHYCHDGSINFRFSYRKQEYMIPVILLLRALKSGCSDKHIFDQITFGDGVGNSFITDRIELLLRGFAGKYALMPSKKASLEFLGSKFHVMLDSTADSTLESVGVELLKKVVLVHLDDDEEKFHLLIFMIQKLYALVSGDCCADNPDSPQHQEILLGGHLYMNYMNEKLTDIINSLKIQIQTDLRKNPASVDFADSKYVLKTLGKISLDIGKKMEYFLATGNLVSNTGLDLQQTSGYTIVAEKLNFFRYISHFQSVHRGSFFAELKTTTVRKLLPEAWGFLCPVHTPDGSPCGLLNHLSHSCKIITDVLDVDGIPDLLKSLGVESIALPPKAKIVVVDGNLTVEKRSNNEVILTVQLDGKIIGWCSNAVAVKIAKTLRYWKVMGLKNIPLDMEIGYVPPSNSGQFPGLFLFSNVARMMRPVKYMLADDKLDMVGPFEQVYMEIACLNEDIVPGITTHREETPTNILSIVANLTPFSDFNQSPRNMYQCQMGKQSMGTPAVNLSHRTDNKLYRLQTGQTPLVRPKLHDEYGVDGYPGGMNAVVAVISYTGYDMEDASIINKSAHERGYGYGTIYKSEFVDLASRRRRGEPITQYFGMISGVESKRLPEKKLDALRKWLDVDGLPYIGTYLKAGDPMYCTVDDVSGKMTPVKYKGPEDAYVEEVRVIGSETGNNEPLQKVHIKLRIRRPPIIGDKFSSRHGQKGVISQKWPMIDMPFTESGMSPDVIINPHAFPSRMTIGMFVESLAGKSAALHGVAQDCTPFTFNEDNPASEFFGEQLKEAGFNYYGNEPMYSGITGKEFKADIYIGLVYYQRLRHMVSDKFQVRTTGPVHDLTQQPVKGRKKGGGVRFGEMERDSLLAHGISFCLQDRLLNCSDYTHANVCCNCGSILSTMSLPRTIIGVEEAGGIVCRMCDSNGGIDKIAIPYVFRYLCTELAAMNVKMKLEIK